MIAIASCYWIGQESFSRTGHENPKITATSFLDDLGAGRIEAAYARTSAGFQACHSAESLRELLNQSPQLRDAESVAARGELVTIRPCTDETDSWSCQVWTREGQLAICLKIITEHGQRRVSTCLAVKSKADQP
jgi:hypothetical protein